MNLLESRLRSKAKLKAYSIKLFVFAMLTVVMAYSSGLFIDMKMAAVGAGMTSAGLIFLSGKRLLETRQEKVCREQTELLLQFLSTETSSGISLDTAFIHAPAHFEKLYSSKNRFQFALTQIAAGLRLQIPLHVLIEDFSKTLSNQESRLVLQVLTTMDFGGTDLPDTLHQQARILGDIKRIERQVAAEHAQQSTESIILCLMPFVILFMLKRGAGDYITASFEDPLGRVLLLVSYVLAITALILNIYFRSKQKAKASDESLVRLKRWLMDTGLLVGLSRRIIDILPKAYVLKVYSAMRVLWTLRDDDDPLAMQFEAGMDELNLWCQLKILWVLIAIPLIILALWIGLPIFYVLVLLIALPLFQDQELFGRANRYQNELMQGLPLFITLMNQLLKSGMVVRRALIFTIAQMPEDSALYRELKLLESNMASGQNAALVLSEFSTRLDIPEAQTALLLLARQETHGGQEMLRQLDLASADCWAILGTAYRRKHELLRQRMFIPMLLDLFAIILMSAAPALLMFIS